MPRPIEPDLYDALPSEEEVYAEHRAALEATLFPARHGLVLELDDGVLRPLR